MTFDDAYKALFKFQATHPRNPVRVEMPYRDWCDLCAEMKGELVSRPAGTEQLFGYPVEIVEGKPLRFIADDDRPQKS
jgi:hypothetical protein